MVTIHLQDDVAAALESKAQREGLSLEGFLVSLTKEPTQKPAVQSQEQISIDEFLAIIDEEAHTGPSPQGTFTRAEIYGDHP